MFRSINLKLGPIKLQGKKSRVFEYRKEGEKDYGTMYKTFAKCINLDPSRNILQTNNLYTNRLFKTTIEKG